MPHAPCGNVKCRRFPMTLREFCRLTAEKCDQPFRAKLGKAAAKLYREIYKKDPPKRRASIAFRNKVGRYPCGILEQAYRQLKDQGVPLVNPNSRSAQRWAREAREKLARDEPPPEWTGSADPQPNLPAALREAIRQ